MPVASCSSAASLNGPLYFRPAIGHTFGNLSACFQTYYVRTHSNIRLDIHSDILRSDIHLDSLDIYLDISYICSDIRSDICSYIRQRSFGLGIDEKEQLRNVRFAIQTERNLWTEKTFHFKRRITFSVTRLGNFCNLGNFLQPLVSIFCPIGRSFDYFYSNFSFLLWKVLWRGWATLYRNCQFFIQTSGHPQIVVPLRSFYGAYLNAFSFPIKANPV